jgi:hypothetical protein
MRVSVDRIFVVNEIGANLSASFRNTVSLMQRRHEPVLFAAVLHHDDCVADHEGLRVAIDATARQMRSVLAQSANDIPVLTGTIGTENSSVSWADETRPSFEVLPFRMPRMFG